MEFPVFKEPDYPLQGWKFHVLAVVPAAAFMILWGSFCVFCVFTAKKSYLAYKASVNDEGKAVARLGHYNMWLFERKTKRPVTYNDVIEIRESMGSTRRDVIREIRDKRRVSPELDISSVKLKSMKPQVMQ